MGHDKNARLTGQSPYLFALKTDPLCSVSLLWVPNIGLQTNAYEGVLMLAEVLSPEMLVSLRFF